MSRPQLHHQIKSVAPFFGAVWVGDKTFEIRKNDRDYQERDLVTLLEYDPKEGEYSGREINGFIRYLTDFEQQPGYVVFQLEVTAKIDA